LALHAGGVRAQVVGGDAGFGVTLRTDAGPVDCAVGAALEDGALHLRLTRFASTLPRDGLASVVHACLLPLERAGTARSVEVRVTVSDDASEVRVVAQDIVAGLLAEGFLAAGWRLPRTRGLCGTLAWSPAAARAGAALLLVAALRPDTAPAAAAAGTADTGQLAGHARLDAARDALRKLLERAPFEPLDVVDLRARLDACLTLDPSAAMRADALLTSAEALSCVELAGGVPASQRDALASELGLRALGADGRSPEVARRVLTLALGASHAARDEPLLAAVLAAPLPAAQQAALVLEALPALAEEAAPRARVWLERVRPFVTDTASLRSVEAALLVAERAAAPDTATAPLVGPAQERAAEALARDRRVDEAAAAFAGAARAYQQARDAQAAARCWVACVTSVSPGALDLGWVAPGAAALQLAGRTRDAIALVATLLSRDVGAADADALRQALQQAVRFHQALPVSLGCPELFEARLRDASPPPR
jgi:tetratricopeptide (TPR) repeat protein